MDRVLKNLKGREVFLEFKSRVFELFLVLNNLILTKQVLSLTEIFKLDFP